jgi:uncharacterized radical SAM superfamily protein
LLKSREECLRILNASKRELENLAEASREISWKFFGKQIRFYAPSFVHYESSEFRSSPIAFPSISITGKFCALRCKHCLGKILETMIPVTSPDSLINTCKQLNEKGSVGCLVSGGCLPDGSIPLDRFADAIAQVKRDSDLTIVVHTGIISDSTARKLKTAGIDAALIDIIGSNETIREIYNLNARVEDYDKSLKALNNSGIPLVPHVLVGLHYGTLKGELQSLEMISKYDPAAVIIIVLMPIRGTPMEDIAPPTPEDIAKVLVTARLMMPTTPLVLGCARPVGRHRTLTDVLAVKAGVNAIAFPAEEAIEFAKTMELTVTFSPICCSQIFADLMCSKFNK